MQMIDLAVGRGCRFCGARDARNTRVRVLAAGTVAPAEQSVPLCPRHLLLLQSAGAEGRLHKPTGERWWALNGATVAAGADATPACPADALIRRGSEGPA